MSFTTIVNNRPTGKVDSLQNLNQDSFLDEEFRGDYLSGTNLIYKGFGRPGAPVTDPVWQICKITYDGNNNITAIQWPENTSGIASNDYQFIWNDRASYTFL